MPRKKQKTDVGIGVKVSEETKKTPLRRSKRKPPDKESDLKPKDFEEFLLPNQRKTLKNPKVSLKRLKTEDTTSSMDLEHSSPESADSGFCTELNIKDKGPTLSEFSKSMMIGSNKSQITVCKPEKSKVSKKSKKYVSKKNSISTNVSNGLSDKKNHNILQDRHTEKTVSPQPRNNTSFIDNNAPASSSETVLQILTQHEFDISSNNKVASADEIKYRISDNDSSSESDWEEVKERENNEQSLEDYNPVIPKSGVEITIDCPELNVRKRKKKQFDHMEYIRLCINRERKEHQLNVHKTHLLCLLAHGLCVNNILNSPILKAFALSLLPPDILALTVGKKIDKLKFDSINNIVSWFCDTFSYDNDCLPFINVQKKLQNYFQTLKSLSPSEYNLLFVVVARTLGLKTRFCISFYPVSHKATNLLKKPGSKKVSSCKTEQCSVDNIHLKTEKIYASEAENPSVKKTVSIKNKKKKLDTSSKKEKSGSQTGKKSQPRRSGSKSYKLSSDDIDSEDDEDFVEKTLVRTKKTVKASKKTSNRKVLSTDSEPPSPENCNMEIDKIICWCEVYSKSEKRWISVECTDKIMDKPYEIEKMLPRPVTYILAFDNDSYVKDVTRRYCSDYMTSTLKLRADSEWWNETLESFSPPNSKLDKEEEKNLDEMLINQPLPKTIGEYKNHPLYALKRHLLKFEAIYPPDAAPVGFIREEPVYARDNIVQLHSRETWLKEARVVRIGEEPYKIVKARPKWDRIAGVMRTDLPLNVFGFWQTQQYEPPVAKDGKVPRNEYGNVELFKPCMLPRGTVHLQMPGLNRVAKKLGIDCSPAVVGFDGHKGSVHPVFDGFVVCEEFKDTILAAWDEEQENARKREEEKREKRIYGNWRKLIRGLLIRERIKMKYDVK